MLCRCWGVYSVGEGATAIKFTLELIESEHIDARKSEHVITETKRWGKKILFLKLKSISLRVRHLKALENEFSISLSSISVSRQVRKKMPLPSNVPALLCYKCTQVHIHFKTSTWMHSHFSKKSKTRKKSHSQWQHPKRGGFFFLGM